MGDKTSSSINEEERKCRAMKDGRGHSGERDGRFLSPLTADEEAAVRRTGTGSTEAALLGCR
jgi:hypothetical protein